MADIEVDKRQTTSDAATGDVRRDVTGVVKGFGSGLKGYLEKAKTTPAVECSIETNVGQYPEGHARAGEFAVQVMVYPFFSRDVANLVADRVTKAVRKKLGA